MNQTNAIVYIVDDDALIRDSLQQLVKSVGLQTKAFSSAQQFLQEKISDIPCCLVLDIRMPVISGVELQEKLIKRDSLIPIIFITGHGTVPMSVRAMKAGAIDFLQKPFEDQTLLDAINHAISKNKQVLSAQIETNDIQQNLQELTRREREILIPVVAGTLNKEIAYQFNMSESTVKTHRSHIMKKMKVNSFAELVRIIDKAAIYPQKNNYL